MGWLLHPDDFDELLGKCVPTSGPLPIGGVAVAPCCVLARGHIQDTAHPELGAPTFAEYGAEHEKIMEAERLRFEASMAVIEKYMAKVPPLNFPYGSRAVIDAKACDLIPGPPAS